MKPYEKYVPSGVEWIGDIPEGWGVKRLKYIAKICNGQDYKAVEAFDGNYPVIGSGGEFARAEKYLYDKISVLLGRKGTIDKPLIVHEPFWTVDTMYYTDINSGFNPNFFYYSTTTINFDLYQYGSTVPSMSQRDLKEIPFALPDPNTQTAIADYLDRETAKIDSIIKAKETLVERLKEKRLSVISHAVTKGLDPNAKMKPSGVEWIGDIPEGWEVKKLSWLFNLISSGTTPDSNIDAYYNGAIPWVNTGDLNDNDLHACEKTITELALQELSVLRIFKKDTLLMAMYGATIGKLSMLGFDATTNQACCAMDCPRNIVTKYVFYCLLGMRKNIISLAYGGGQPNISQALIRDIKISLPLNMEEQTAIADYLDTETAKIDSTIEKTKLSIEKLKEYRTALISACVTGKIDVRS